MPPWLHGRANLLGPSPVLLGAVLAGLFLAMADPGQAAQPPKLVPLADFFRNPAKTDFQISPDGKTLAYLAPWRGRLNIYLRQVGESFSRRLTASTDQDISAFGWKGDDAILYLQDSDGDENDHLFAVALAAPLPRDLTPFPGVRAEIQDDLPDEPGAVMLRLNRRRRAVFDLYRLDILSGKLTLAVENPGNVDQWILDQAGLVRAAVARRGLESALLYRRDGDGPFREVLTWRFPDTLAPLAFTFDNQNLYVATDLGRDTQAIQVLDPDSGRLGRTLLARYDVDAAGLILSRKLKAPALAYCNTDRPEYKALGPAWQAMLDDLQAQLPDREFILQDHSQDESTWLLRAFSDRTPGEYYLYDLPTRSLTNLGEISPGINQADMAPMRPVRFPARDGLELRGYLTLPQGQGQGPWPMVLLVHGGPWTRDYWGFDAEAQFMANRGLAVLQVNFRGSTGYGKAFWTAGFKEWGRAMQDDLSDAVAWAVGQGLADPKRVGIFGASYGGYAALAGLAFTPELYACGVDYAGPSNLISQLGHMPAYWGLEQAANRAMIGDPIRDRELLRQASPLFHLERIRAALLIAQGANDPRVNRRESDQVVRILRARGLPVRYMLKENEGHGFGREENDLEFYRAVEGFLARHLGGRRQ